MGSEMCIRDRLNNLDALDGTIGLETMCVAGGMGQAMVVERLA